MYKRILIFVTSGPAARTAVNEGVALAKVHDAEVLFFSVLPKYVLPVMEMPLAMVSIPPMDVSSPDAFLRDARKEAERLLAAATAVADKMGVPSQYAVGAGVDDAECIVREARKRRCGLIVVASAGRSALVRLLSGSVIPGLITHSPIPVLVCRHPDAKRKAMRGRAAAPRPPKVEAEAGGRERRKIAA